MNKILLKKDLFGEIWQVFDANQSTISRQTREARWWLRWLSRYLMRREARALAALSGLDGVPQLLSIDDDSLTRCFIDGNAMYVARPTDAQYFKEAFALLRRVHRAGVVHNDLAKEPNILVDDDGHPAFIDFQLASFSARRSRLFRVAAREDIRHLLKHKRTYCADLLTRRERSILDSPAAISRAYMATVKPLYVFVTRKLLGWSDREGAADR